MSIPKSISNVLYELLEGAVEGLTEKLRATAGVSFDPNQPASNAPTLPKSIQDDPRYQQAMVAYWQLQADIEQQLSTNNIEAVNLLQAQEFKARRQLSQLRRDLIRESQLQKIAIKLQEMPAIWQADNWFAKLSRTETEQILQQAQQQHRLLILLAPPFLSSECPASFHNHLRIILSNQVNSFLGQHYPHNCKFRPVHFYGDYFLEPIASCEVKKLPELLDPVPTGILYSDINDDEVIFHLGFWAVLSGGVALFTMPAWNWSDALQALRSVGYSKRDAHRAIGEIIVTVHKLLGAFVADWYYLNIDPSYEPQLFELFSEFDREEQNWAQPYIATLQQMQQAQLTVYENQMEQLADEAFEKLKADNNWRSVRTLTGYNIDLVNALAISPDSQSLACASRDNNITIWQLTTGQLIRSLRDHSLPVMSVAITPDGETVVSGSRDSSIKIWQLKSCKLLRTLKGHANWVCAVAITPDGETIVSGGRDKNIKIWQLKTGKLIRSFKGHLRQINSLSISPDGQTFISGSYDNTIKVWELSTGQLIHSLEGHTDSVNNLAISPDGQIIVSGSSDKTIKIWELSTGNLIRSLEGHSGEINAVIISADGQIIASGSSDKTIKIWELNTGKFIRTITGHSDRILTLAISLSGQTIVSSSDDKTMKIWWCSS
ncbi:MAG: WD40 repeat domain-containing protein [Hormoscilla sp. GM7CHS1pb]|nr:WD40 repeat domain-containing protein [Hormoscilla sp. GM7CHS1pb]